MSLQFPTLHLGGTSKGALAADYRLAGDALYHAIEVVSDSAPNPRDYSPDGYVRAVEQHTARIEKLRSVAEELGELYGACL